MAVKHKFKNIESLVKRCKLSDVGCLEWSGSLSTKGYGMTTSGGKFYRVHRLMWILHHGEIPSEKQINHTCDNTICTNINHLYLGTHQQNMDDIVARKRHRNTKKTHCIKGHQFSVENTRVTPGGLRVCRKCHAEYNLEHKKNQRRIAKKFRKAECHDFVFNLYFSGEF